MKQVQVFRININKLLLSNTQEVINNNSQTNFESYQATYKNLNTPILSDLTYA